MLDCETCQHEFKEKEKPEGGKKELKAVQKILGGSCPSLHCLDCIFCLRKHQGLEFKQSCGMVALHVLVKRVETKIKEDD